MPEFRMPNFNTVCSDVSCAFIDKLDSFTTKIFLSVSRTLNPVIPLATLLCAMGYGIQREAYERKKSIKE